LPGDHPHRFVIHDRDRIFSADVDQSLTHLGVRVLRTRVRAPKANGVRATRQQPSSRMS
jgi:hypothetical protein